MKVCTYIRQTPLGQFKRLGIFFNETTIVDVNLVWQKCFEDEGHFDAKKKALEIAPPLLSDFLTHYQDAAIEMLRETLEEFEVQAGNNQLKTLDGADLAFDLQDDKSVKLGAPLDKINCYRDFYAHEKHVAKGFEKRGEPIPEAWYEIPAYYKGPTTGFIGNDDLITWPSYTNKLDYELEFGLVIGKDGKNIKAQDAHNHIFGYTIFNDISARDIQKKEMAIRLGPAKGKDFCSIIGPVIITADEFDFKEPNLKMSATINGEKWSEGYTGDSHYTWAQMIEHASKEEWLHATDFMGSGTVGTGCGLEIDKWIQPGDIIELEIERIGKLKNIVGTPSKE
ncbi:MAG: fumarylacetoacetate hydrolase family protein [Bacteriovoracaceae bacterium]|jgi:2-keto-4-pentenoate hydratase/2-oxohepta-3-ene-1,7-dioic acid hydratase in catechol pathway|nr:fumarylacetoacetate hydrolase family protein [Bacteriovoracaceae bacterium]